MSVVATYIVPILIFSGAATACIFLLVVFPKPLTRALFGVDPTSPFQIFLARYVGLLVFLVGCLILYSAFHPELRPAVLVAACIEKIFFVGFVSFGGFKRTPLLVAAAIADACFSLLYLAYLFRL